MTISVSNQAYIFLCSVAGGMLIAFIYDLFRVKRRAIKTNRIITYIEDLLFWILVALVMFASVSISNEGEIRGFIFIGTALGVILYILLLSRIVMASAMFILGVIFRVVKAVWFLLAYPFKIIYKVLRIPAGYLQRILKKSFRSMKRAGRIRLAKAGMWKRIFKNIRKKI